MLANYECDLHGHTNRSDGNDSPVEYIRHAVHRGVKILAITDHDIVPPEMIELGGGKRQEITAYAKGIGVELLRGIEISCETYIDDVHLVCLGCDWNAPYFKELDEKKAKLMLSNSNPKNTNKEDNFFEEIYKGFNINEISAKRMINANCKGRGAISELLITNYEEN